MVEDAQRQLNNTVVRAPFDGIVTNVPSLQVGSYLKAAQQAFSLVSTTHLWISASPKETELTHVRPGQPVSIEIDAYPDRTFTGHIASIQAGSGTAFSLLPAENATGNYVKIVQRVPVKIVFDKPPDVLLGPGMSVVPTVKVR